MNGASHPPTLQPQVTRPSPSLTPGQYQHQSISPAPNYARQTIQQVQAAYRATLAPSTPATQQNHHAYNNHQTIHPQPTHTPTHSTNFPTSATPSSHTQKFTRPVYQQPTPSANNPAYPAYPSTTPAAAALAAQANAYPDPRSAEVFTLSETANASIPAHIRAQLPQDDQGRVLFFAKPPKQQDVTVRGKDGSVLKHTEKYLIAKAERERLKEERKRQREGGIEVIGGEKRVRV